MSINSRARAQPTGIDPAQGGSVVIPHTGVVQSGLKMKRRFWPWLILSGVGASVIGGLYGAYVRDMRAIAHRLSTESRLIQTSHGPVEFAVRGEGPPVMVVHGAGGGYDQGILIADTFGGNGFRWIAPSRFGYLRTPLPEDASTRAQADAFAGLLDALGIERIGILAISGGVPPSLQFAAHYPARVSSLVLLSSAPYTPLKADEQARPIPAWAYQTLFSSNFPYWLLQRLARRRLEALFDVAPALRETLTPEDRTLVSRLIDAFQPVTQRVDGVRNEAAAIDPRAHYALDRITAPTLVIHARDDGMNPFSVGEHIAAHVPNARFMPLTSGGHPLLGHQAEVLEHVSAFLRKFSGP